MTWRMRTATLFIRSRGADNATWRRAFDEAEGWYTPAHYIDPLLDGYAVSDLHPAVTFLTDEELKGLAADIRAQPS